MDSNVELARDGPDFYTLNLLAAVGFERVSGRGFQSADFVVGVDELFPGFVEIGIDLVDISIRRGRPDSV